VHWPTIAAVVTSFHIDPSRLVHSNICSNCLREKRDVDGEQASRTYAENLSNMPQTTPRIVARRGATKWRQRRKRRRTHTYVYVRRRTPPGNLRSRPALEEVGSTRVSFPFPMTNKRGVGRRRKQISQRRRIAPHSCVFGFMRLT